MDFVYNKYWSNYTHPPLFLMDNIKLDWIPTKIRRLNNKIPPALLLVLQCLFQVLRRHTALLPKSYKIQIAVLFVCCFRSVSNPHHFKFLRTPYNRKKEKIWYSPVSSVLLTKFRFLSVSSVSILINWFDWKAHHNEMTMWFPKGRCSKPGS